MSIYEELKEMIESYNTRTLNDNSWIIKVEDIKAYDLSHKIPSKLGDIVYENPKVIMDRIMKTVEENLEFLDNLSNIL